MVAGCSDMKEAFQFQDDYASSFSVCEDAPAIFLSRKYHPKTTRGIIPTEYSAELPQGVYIPVACSAGRIFYQASIGFGQFKNGRVESGIGGIVQAEQNNWSTFYVWFFKDEIDYYQIKPNGEWIETVKPGFFNTPLRPWIEKDLKIEISVEFKSDSS